MIADNVQAIGRDLEELASRGFNHPDSSALVGRMRVALEQIASSADQPAPPSEPVHVELARLNLEVAALAEAVGPVVQRQVDASHALGMLSQSVTNLTERVETWLSSQTGNP